jgi:hypothetical protein
MALTRDSANITQLGSGKATILVLNSAGSALTAWQPMPWIADSTLTDETAQDTIDTEGSTQFTVDGSRTRTLSLTVMQKDLDSIQFMKANRGNYAQIVKEVNEDPLDGQHNYLVVGKAKINPNLTLQGRSGTQDYTFTIEEATGFPNIALSSANTAGSFSTTISGTATISTGYDYEFLEFAAT